MGRKKESFFSQTYPIHKRVKKEVYYEFQNVCEEIGVAENLMLEEIIKGFCKEMNKAKKYGLKTIYGDLFPTNGD